MNRSILSILGLSVLLVGCNPSTNNGAVSIQGDCENPSDPNNVIAGVNSIFKSLTIDAYQNRPLDMGISLYVSLDGVFPADIESIYLEYPNGTEVEGGNFSLSTSSGTDIYFYNAFFAGYSKTDGLNKAPMTDYCVQIALTNGDSISKIIDMERPDGTAPASGELMVHDSHYASITSGGDYSRGMAIPVINSASLTEAGLTLTATINDNRATEFEVSIFGSDGRSKGTYFTADTVLIKNDGQKTYDIAYADIDTDLAPADLVASATYVFISVFDTGSANGGYQPSYSELSANSLSVDF